jgi:hypothetical protein
MIRMENSDKRCDRMTEKQFTVEDIEDMIYQAIELGTPFVIKCEECAKLPIEDEDEEE